MSYTPLIKGLVLISFVSLISIFILYRMDRLNAFFKSEPSHIQASPNSDAFDSAKADTMQPSTIDSLQKLRMSSSKSILIFDKNPNLLDTIKRKYKPSANKNENPLMFSGSKSGPIIRQGDIRFFLDSLKKDSLKNQKIKPKQ
jgi:hypothetical protein